MWPRRDQPAAPVARALEFQPVEQARSGALTARLLVELGAEFSPAPEAVTIERSAMVPAGKLPIFQRRRVVSLRLKVAGSVCF